MADQGSPYHKTFRTVESPRDGIEPNSKKTSFSGPAMYSPSQEVPYRGGKNVGVVESYRMEGGTRQRTAKAKAGPGEKLKGGY